MKDTHLVLLIIAFVCALVAGVLGVLARNVTLVLLAVAAAILAAVQIW